MQSVQAGKWDPPSKQHATPLAQPHQPQTRPSHVNAPQAKRITFYKSGDSQFGGVKMAVHKRSFKCFDALLDDLSQKVPLPFGVRTVTTPRGTHTIRHLEQLQDGGCYLCSDRRQAKPINMDITTKRSGVWSHHGRRPHRPESTSATPPGHVPYRQRRLLLVKNTEPAMRRSVVLSRRVTRSLRAFLEEASDVMQFHVRKLYTVEGRKIDNVQSLMTCPNVLVCVGREAFSPLLVNYIRKSSDEKLPGLETRTPGNGARSPPQGAQSRASEHSEGQDSKKNMPRFSMSSEKSCGLSTASQGHAAILNDDIEKRVIVNKDGSLSVEMKVRFRLHSDETLQWSTQIKKSPSLTNDCCSTSQAQSHYLQHESCSDPDCNSYEPEIADYSSQCAMDTNMCPCCYRQGQQYDLWKNPTHSHKQPIPPSHSTTESHTILRQTHSSSSTSSCNSTRVVRCRARITNCEDGSEHSQIVQEEMCVTEQHVVEQEVSTVSRSCSQSEVFANGDEVRPLSSKSGEEEVERPMSVISASSHVLQELKEDDDELPPSASRCDDAALETFEMQNDDRPASNASAKQNEEEEGSTCRCPSASGVEGNGRTSTAKSKAGSFKSTKEAANDDVEEVKTVVSGLSAGSRKSGTSLCSNCGGWKLKVASGCNSRASNRSNNKSPRPTTGNSAIDEDDNSSDVSTLSNTSNLTDHREVSMISNGDIRAASAMSKPEEEEQAKEARATSVTSNKSRKSGCENNETVEIRSPSVISALSENSNCSAVPDPIAREAADGDDASERVASAMSVKSSTSAKTKSSIKVTAPTTEEEETRSASVQSEKSNASAKSNRPDSTKSTKPEEQTRATSVQSVKSNESANTSRPASAKSHVSEKSQNAEEETRAASVLSVKSNKSRSASPMSVKSSKSEVSENEQQNLEVKSNGNKSRPASVLSVKSIKSDASKKSENVKEEPRAASVISVKSNVTAKSTKSNLSVKSAKNEAQNMEGNNENVEVTSSASAKESRPASVISVKSTKSQKSSKSEVQNTDEDARPVSVVSVKSKSAKESRPTSVLSVKSSKSQASEKCNNENVEETRPASAISSASNATNQTEKRSVSPKSNVEKDGEERGESALSSKSRKSSKLNCNENGQNGEEKQEERAASAISSKSVLSVKSSKTNKSSRLATPAKDQEGERAVSATSGKTHISTVSAKSKKSNQTVISINVNGENDNKSDRVTSPVSVKSNKSSRFHVITIKTPEVVSNDRSASSASNKTEKSNVSARSKQNKKAAVENDNGNEKILEDQATKSRNSNCTQELMPESTDLRGTSSLSVRSGKSGKSKCTCGETNKDIDDTKEDSEVAASIPSQKIDDADEDSFASVSLVLPDDQESESGESNVSSNRNKSKTSTPEVSKSPVNVADVGPTTPNATNIPTIETPGQGNNDEDASDEKSRVASSCSTKSTRSVKSTKSKKSCSNCGKLTTQEAANGTASPVGSVKSIATTRTGQLTAPDNRTTSAMSTASAKNQRKLAKNEDDDNASEESSEQASETKVEDDTLARTNSKSPSRLQPISGSTRSTNSSKVKNGALSAESSQKKEVNAKSQSTQNHSIPASKGDTCSESLLSHSLSAADLAKETKATERPESSRSKVNKSAMSQRSKKEAEQELTPSCLPNASPNEVVSDWLNRIPANMLALGDEDEDKCVEDVERGNGVGEEAEVKGEDEEVKTEVSEGEKAGAKEEGKVETFEIRQVGMVTETSLPKSWHSSAAVMKVLLSSSVGRCRSMPEVSPVYGRRLSASARQLLDCLTQLQLIEPTGNQGYSVQKDQRPQFEDIISILQSLWLAEPGETVDPKDPNGTDQISPPRSSSGVDMSSGSGGSGKDNVNQEDEPRQDGEQENKTEEASESPDDAKATENPSSLDKNSKTPTDNDLDTQEDTQEGSSSESPPTVLKAPLSKRQSQDPDPMWVLRLLKKLEKQFINHYVTAMADFKVKWDLEDSLILDRMIVELKDEVSQRIERSVEREMKKIQGRAGKRVPRPPLGGNQSTDSVMTEKRRRLLKVNTFNAILV
uniref:Doublecortin domain-containing protein n=1 Tax=Periophthalmus magnuspinnatus TaxID=409849 RepID=A0A3B4B8Z5_9GOBI